MIHPFYYESLSMKIAEFIGRKCIFCAIFAVFLLIYNNSLHYPPYCIMSILAINTILFCVFIHLSWQNGFLLIYGKKNRQGLGEACAGSGAANFLSVTEKKTQ